MPVYISCAAFREDAVFRFVICHTTPVPMFLSSSPSHRFLHTERSSVLFFCVEGHLVPSPFSQHLLLLFQFFSDPVEHILGAS